MKAPVGEIYRLASLDSPGPARRANVQEMNAFAQFQAI
jgi:hypothetical protein